MAQWLRPKAGEWSGPGVKSRLPSQRLWALSSPVKRSPGTPLGKAHRGVSRPTAAAAGPTWQFLQWVGACFLAPLL